MKFSIFISFSILFFLGETSFSQNQLYNFNFNLIDLEPEEQVRITDSIGFEGLVVSVFNMKHVEQFEAFKNTPAIKNGTSKILAAYLPYNYENPNTEVVLDALLPKLENTETVIWLVVKSPKEDKKLTYNLVKTICNKANKFGVKVVLYPHDISAIESSEEALKVLKKVKASNLYLSLHTNHELRYGNADRLEKVIKKTLKYTEIVGISGANTIGNYNRGSKDWSDVVQPLIDSPYNCESFYKLLTEYGYKGPFVLQNFGIKIKPQIHLSESLRTFKSW